MPREETVDFADSSRLKSQFPSELTEDGSLPPRLLSSELGSYSHGFPANLPGRARAFPPGVWSFWPITPSGRDSPGSEPPRLCPAILASVRAPWLWPEAGGQIPIPQEAVPAQPPARRSPVTPRGRSPSIISCDCCCPAPRSAAILAALSLSGFCRLRPWANQDSRSNRPANGTKYRSAS